MMLTTMNKLYYFFICQIYQEPLAARARAERTTAMRRSQGFMAYYCVSKSSLRAV